VITKAQLEILIVANGGTIVQNPQPKTFCVVSGESNFPFFLSFFLLLDLI